MGPDASASSRTIRYVNAGSYSDVSGIVQYFDLVLANTTSYTPHDASLNQIHAGKFARVNVACNEQVGLRVSTVRSCASAPSCKRCDAMSSSSARDSCFASGCSCFGQTVYMSSRCVGATKEAHRILYACDEMDTAVILPGSVMTTMTVYDLEGEDGDNHAQITVPGYAYYKTPLRAASDNAALVSSVDVDLNARSFRGTSSVVSGDEPTDPQSLTDEQASKGVQFFFVASQGFVDATFTVVSSAPDCTGRSLLFAGDSCWRSPSA